MSTGSTLFKDIYTPKFIDGFGKIAKHVYPSFDNKAFTKSVFGKDWGSMELKQRARHISNVLYKLLPESFPDAADLLVAIVKKLQEEDIKDYMIAYIFIPDYIEVYGIGHFKESVKAMEYITTFISCEFAVRPFILKYGDRMIKHMVAWGNHKDHRVRRLASEGCRPRLPWAVALPALKKDPAPILPMLEKLKDDKHEWVRRSVANNFNDISKDNPEIVLALFKKWHGKTKETDWVIKHGSRTLLKQGHTELLGLFGFVQDNSVSLLDFSIDTPKVKWDGDLVFRFTVKNISKQTQKIRLEYAMYYLKANGTHSKKVFKISEREYTPGETCAIVRKQSFRPIRTRVYHPGLHKVAIIINGIEKDVLEFRLVKA